jgi:lactoylglutathione lyase
MRFGHVAIRIKDLNKMLHFYCRGLGLHEAFRINNDDGSLRIVYLHISDGQYLELCLGGDKRLDFDDQKSLGVRHISFTVDDLQEFKKEAEKRGVVFDSEILKLRDNNLTVFLFDPDGNKLEIVQTQPDSPHKKFEASLK